MLTASLTWCGVVTTLVAFGVVSWWLIPAALVWVVGEVVAARDGNDDEDDDAGE